MQVAFEVKAAIQSLSRQPTAFLEKADTEKNKLLNSKVSSA